MRAQSGKSARIDDCGNEWIRADTTADTVRAPFVSRSPYPESSRCGQPRPPQPAGADTKRTRKIGHHDMRCVRAKSEPPDAGQGSFQFPTASEECENAGTPADDITDTECDFFLSSSLLCGSGDGGGGGGGCGGGAGVGAGAPSTRTHPPRATPPAPSAAPAARTPCSPCSSAGLRRPRGPASASGRERGPLRRTSPRRLGRRRAPWPRV